MIRLAAVLPLLLVACGAPSPAKAPAARSAPPVSAEPPSPASSKEAHVDLSGHKAAYERATNLAEEGDLLSAIATLEPFARATESSTNEPLAYWIHNQLTWLYWGRGNLAGAIREAELGEKALDRSKLPVDDVEGMRLHALWDRAYLLLELGEKDAERAFAEYESLAAARDDHDGLAVLTAFFRARQKQPAEAMAAAKRVDVEHDSDLQDLYVVALALDAGGDPRTAESVRKRICVASTYMMKPLIVAQMTREGFVCPVPSAPKPERDHPKKPLVKMPHPEPMRR